MFEAFSAEANAAMDRARGEAAALGSAVIAPPHLLLALLAAPDADLQGLLALLAIDAPASRGAVAAVAAATIVPGAEPPDLLPFAPGTRRALREASRLAAAVGDDRVRTVHLFWGRAEAANGTLRAALHGNGVAGGLSGGLLQRAGALHAVRSAQQSVRRVLHEAEAAAAPDATASAALRELAAACERAERRLLAGDDDRPADA